MMRCALEHPDLQGLRRFALLTANAQKFYEGLGFGPLRPSRTYMERC